MAIELAFYPLFYPNSWDPNQWLQQYRLNHVQTISKKSIYTERDQIDIKNDQKRSKKSKCFNFFD